MSNRCLPSNTCIQGYLRKLRKVLSRSVDINKVKRQRFIYRTYYLFDLLKPKGLLHMRKGRDGNEYKEGIEDGTRVGGRGIEEYYFQKIFIQKRDES